MKVLVDTDIWLDVALGRDGHDTSLATLYGCIAACARTENIDLVITRNTEPFRSLGIPASTPDEFVEDLGFTAIDLGAL